MEIFRIIADTLNSKALIKANTLGIFHQLSIINQQQLLDQTTGRFLAQAERMRLPLLDIWIGAEKHNAGLWTAGTIHQETQELQGCCTPPHRWRIRKSWPEERRKSEPRGFPDWVRYPPDTWQYSYHWAPQYTPEVLHKAELLLAWTNFPQLLINGES